MKSEVFEAFDNGKLELLQKTIEFKDIPWTDHPVFAGVELKHIIKAEPTGSAF